MEQNSPTEIKTTYCAQWAMDMRDRKRCEWRVRECCHGRTLSLGVCVMKTGHSRAVGTVGAFAGVSAVSPCWLSAARVSRMSKEVGKLNRGGDVKWMSGAWFVKAGGKAAVTYHLKSSWRREQRGREGREGGSRCLWVWKSLHHISPEGRQEKWRSGFTRCDCDTPAVVSCSGSVTCGDAMLHHIFLEVMSPTRAICGWDWKSVFPSNLSKFRFANCLIKILK